MRYLLFCFSLFSIISCVNEDDRESSSGKDTTQVSDEIKFKVLDSRFMDEETLWAPFEDDLEEFTVERYKELRTFIIDRNIPEMQNSISAGHFSYEELVLFYLYRIRKYDRNNDLSLNSVISLNPKIVTEAREKDELLKSGEDRNLIFGIPVLLKDNINTKGMPTTAGAVALQRNQTGDAFIVKKLKENGALILGKSNLSEWAYFFCGDCPSGYSAVGGQTLNPYGRKIFDTGGSSSGSAVAVTANIAPVAVGSETSGSILSPSSQNSVVGLKPTIGVLSRGGIIPISNTLDTPGPITKSVIDNAILFSAMTGKDSKDLATEENYNGKTDYYNQLKTISLKGKRFGAIEELIDDTLYAQAIEDLRNAGAKIIVFKPEEIELPDFLRLLNLDMKKDLPQYFEDYGGNTGFSSVEDIVIFNIDDSTSRAPYGQALFEGILQDTTNDEEFSQIKDVLRQNGKRFFDVPMNKHNLDAVLSINSNYAGFAAVAQYPAITVPMGYTEDKAPKGLTFIARPYREASLLRWAYGYEQATKRRKSPLNYQN